MKQEIAGGAGLLALAILYLFSASGIPQSTLSDDVGARGMPYLLGGLLIVVSVAIMARGVFALVATPSQDDETSSLPRALGVLACAGLYVVIAWLAGYIVATAITLLAIMLYEGAKFNVKVFAIAVIGALFFWLSFVVFLGVEQPVGKLFGA